MKKRNNKQPDFLTVSMDLEVEKTHDHRELEIFDVKEEDKKKKDKDIEGIHLVNSTKVHDTIAIVQDDVKLKKDQQTYKGCVIYRKKEIDLLKSEKPSQGVLETIHLCKKYVGGTYIGPRPDTRNLKLPPMEEPPMSGSRVPRRPVPPLPDLEATEELPRDFFSEFFDYEDEEIPIPSFVA